MDFLIISYTFPEVVISGFPLRRRQAYGKNPAEIAEEELTNLDFDSIMKKNPFVNGGKTI